MATAQGSPSQVQSILILKETTWGTAVTPSKDVGLILDSTDSLNREVIPISGLGAVEVQQIVTGSVSAAGSITFQMQHLRIFQFLIGDETPVNSSSDWRHTFAIADIPESFSLETGENAASESKEIYEGCIGTAAEISIALGGVLTCRFDWAGQTTNSTNTATAPSLDNLPVFPQGLVDVKVNGTTAIMVQNASITITKTFVPLHGIKSNLMQAAFTTDLKFEFNATLGFTGVTLQELGLGGATPPATSDPTGIEFEINADNGVAFGSGQRNIQIVLENCQFSQTTKVATLGAITFLTLSGEGTLKTLIGVDDISDLN